MKQVLIFFLFCQFNVWSQTPLDSLQNLDEVVLKSDVYLKTFSETKTVRNLYKSELDRSAPSLTQLLNSNTTIYFKENGLGMVSSPSFRGTTAQQTAVVWNGININSQFNGQTDFNTINIRNFNDVAIRSGGGSVLYGSGAIGGTIHLNNNIEFNKGFQNNLVARYGSFNTLDLGYQSSFSSNKFSVNIALSRLSSSNNYKYVDNEKSNLNGAFFNQSMSANVAYKINYKNVLKLYSYLYDGERHFSLIFPSETPTKYQDLNSRSMLEWDGFYGRFNSTLKLAYISENYKYFANSNKGTFSFGEAKKVIGNYNLNYAIFKNANLQGVFDITNTKGEGSSIEKSERLISGFSVLYNQQFDRFLYEVSLRKEITNNYESPLLYSLGLQYQSGSHYTININGSKNFRIPTYNDLYWEGSGNLDLSPETSLQIEMEHELNFKQVSFTATGFYNNITDMIRWVPTGSMWMPINTDHVEIYGLEVTLDFRRNLNAHQFELSGNYSYTVSKNAETKKQLIYVPNQKATAVLNYQFKPISAFFQTMYVGDVFMLSDNNPKYIVESYLVSNAGITYAFGKTHQYVIGAQVNNVFNENYQSVADRYMPGINYNFNLNLNF